MIHDIQYNEDDRAQRCLNVFDSLDGQVNISYVNSTSHVVEFQYISDKNPRVLEIPPSIWHGYKALEPNSIMLYYLTEKYDPKDEWKCPVGVFNEDWETENK